MASNSHFLYLFPMDVQRVKAFSDNIFSFAMTLLIMIVTVPQVTSELAPTQLPKLLVQQWPNYLIYLISFMNISNYWMAHYSIFANIIRSDRTLIRLNTLLLLSVTFLPYPAQLMSQYGRLPIVALLYGITISLSYLFLTFIVWYAYSNNRLTNPQLHLPVKRIILLRMVFPLCLAILGTVLAYFYTRLSFIFYFLVSLTSLLPLQLFMKGVEIVVPTESEQ